MSARDDIPAAARELAETIAYEWASHLRPVVADDIVRAILADRSSRPAQHEADRDRAAEEERHAQNAALKWCGEKERETFPEDITYFMHNWRSLPGLRAYVEREIGRAALRSSPHKGGTETADTPHEPDCAYHLDQYPNECDCARRGGGDER